MPPLVTLPKPCQLGQEGEGGVLIQATRSATDHPRRPACLFGDDAACDTDDYDNT